MPAEVLVSRESRLSASKDMTDDFESQPDHRTRISLFTTNLVVTPALVVTAQAQDSLNTVYPLPVEWIVTLPDAVGLAQIIVKLPDGVPAGDLRLSITARSRSSNVVLVGITP